MKSSNKELIKYKMLGIILYLFFQAEPWKSVYPPRLASQRIFPEFCMSMSNSAYASHQYMSSKHAASTFPSNVSKSSLTSTVVDGVEFNDAFPP